MKIKIDHINLTVRNLPESISWYEKLFGFELKEGDLTSSTDSWAIIGKDDYMLCMYEDRNLKPAAETSEGPFHRIYHFGIRITDREEWERKLAENNIEVKYGGAYKYPRSLSWYFFDPSGHEIEVSWTVGPELRFEGL